MAGRVAHAPSLDESASFEDRVDVIVEWFRSHFDDPANGLPYDSNEGGYQWIDGGPYDAREEIESAFPEASEDELNEAVDRIEGDGVFEWMGTYNRAHPYPQIEEPETIEEREVPPNFDPHKFSIVETTLFPRLKFDWSVHATFVPVKTNQDISDVARAIVESGRYGRDDYTFDSLRHLVGVLIGPYLEGREVGNDPVTEQAYEWVKSLDDDGEVFVDDGVIVHASPPEWLPLRKLFEHGAVSGVALMSQEPGHWAGVLLMYGGSLIFLRIVKNLNFVQDALFERVVERIKKGSDS